LSNEEKSNDYENFEKGMMYMKILKKGGVVEKRGEDETKSMPHAPVHSMRFLALCANTRTCNLRPQCLLH
jgi:hypothetical protein